MITAPEFDGSQLLKGALDLVVLAAVAGEENYGYEVARSARPEPSGGILMSTPEALPAQLRTYLEAVEGQLAGLPPADRAELVAAAVAGLVQ
jgi:hypothetical protein